MEILNTKFIISGFFDAKFPLKKQLFDASMYPFSAASSPGVPPYCIRWCAWSCGIGALQPMKPAPGDKAVF